MWTPDLRTPYFCFRDTAAIAWSDLCIQNITVNDVTNLQNNWVSVSLFNVDASLSLISDLSSPSRVSRKLNKSNICNDVMTYKLFKMFLSQRSISLRTWHNSYNIPNWMNIHDIYLCSQSECSSHRVPLTCCFNLSFFIFFSRNNCWYSSLFLSSTGMLSSSWK